MSTPNENGEARAVPLDVFLKGGGVVHLVVTHASVQRSLLGELQKLSWTVPDDQSQILYIDLSEVAAVIERPYAEDIA